MIRLLLAAALLTAAACSGGGEQPPAAAREEAAAANAADEPAVAEANAAAATTPADGTEAKVGPASFRYPASLAAVEAQLSVPPDWADDAPGTKLIPADRAGLIGKAECLYGQSGEASRCNPAQEAGLGFAMLDRPYAALAATLKDPPSRPVTFAGREGVSWTIGAEGEGAEHILVPAPGGTLLIVRQFRASADADPAELDAVLRSLRIDG